MQIPFKEVNLLKNDLRTFIEEPFFLNTQHTFNTQREFFFFFNLNDHICHIWSDIKTVFFFELTQDFFQV